MTLAHDAAGTGPALILLHSGVCDRRMWDPQWAALTGAGYRVVRCDFRGFGDSPLPARPHNDAEDVLDLMDTLGIEQAALIGSSYGGQVAVEIAARHPDRVTALALLCAGLPDHAPTDALRAFGEREDTLLEAGDVAAAVELNVDTWLGPDAGDAAREAVRTMQRHAFDVQLAAPEGAGRKKVDVDPAAAKAPCLTVSGGHDVADFRHIAARVADLLPEARHVELPWAGHLPSLERPTATTELLTGFLRETVPAS
ncbi:alpha/beta fold hydrolase [Streptomyces sp. VRA16 Mangrove soil]|uniref:alpha/beta fold hydrolase n=1 Tax=Streptomyces sp. VRA16 Mangrove soil TaxID=2817434 RepID=UPI001A9DCF45|nr:alpha/beta hydrolase [Streptomyces sp. VRA16 Mangrove soil]MBO1336923.1 alpha/beta fold hydrolase [Streptomyces sp. VRA16 Mangrove soil]